MSSPKASEMSAPNCENRSISTSASEDSLGSWADVPRRRRTLGALPTRSCLANDAGASTTAGKRPSIEVLVFNDVDGEDLFDQKHLGLLARRERFATGQHHRRNQGGKTVRRKANLGDEEKSLNIGGPAYLWQPTKDCRCCRRTQDPVQGCFRCGYALKSTRLSGSSENRFKQSDFSKNSAYSLFCSEIGCPPFRKARSRRPRR